LDLKSCGYTVLGGRQFGDLAVPTMILVNDPLKTSLVL